MFIVRQIADNRYQREGDDLIMRVRIKLPDALSESKIDVPHIDGRILRVPLKEASSWPSCPLRVVLVYYSDTSVQGGRPSCLLHGLSTS